jgi:hypothetical protein
MHLPPFENYAFPFLQELFLLPLNLVTHKPLAYRKTFVLFHKTPDKQKTVQHYLSLLAKQLSLFSTEEGKKSIDRFKTQIVPNLKNSG